MFYTENLIINKLLNEKIITTLNPKNMSKNYTLNKS